MGESLKKRDEIRLEDTWDLGGHDALRPGLGGALLRDEGQTGDIQKFPGKIKEDGQAPATVWHLTTGYPRISRRSTCTRSSLWTRIRGIRNTRSTPTGRTRSAARPRGSPIYRAEILEIPDVTMKEFYPPDAGASALRTPVGADRVRETEHTLDPAIEEILARSMEATQNPAQIFGMFNNADIQFDPAVDGKGNQVTVTHGALHRSDAEPRPGAERVGVPFHV